MTHISKLCTVDLSSLRVHFLHSASPMHTVKRQRVQAPESPPTEAQYVSASGSVQWQAEVAKILPALVTTKVLAMLLADPALYKTTQDAITHCCIDAKLTLKKTDAAAGNAAVGTNGTRRQIG